MNKRHYEHTLPNIRGSLSNTYEATYQHGRLHGKERRLIVTNRYDYWEISTYVNGRKTGLFESRYVKNDAVRETGEYLNGRRVGRWKMYDIDGKLEKEWEETKQYRDE